MRRPSANERTPLSEAGFCAVDVETSGLRTTSRVVEIGAVRFDLDGEREEFQALVNPCERISPGATAIHGITDEMAAGAPRAPDVLPGLMNFVAGRVLVAHNARFDVRMIGNELARAGMEAPAVPVVCTLGLARRTLPGPPDYRLETLVEHLSIEVPGLHSALPDAHAAMRVFTACAGPVDSGGPVGALPGYLGSFHSAAPPTVREAPATGNPDQLAELARSRLAIEMDYASSDRPLVVTPLYLYEGKAHNYMKAYCHRTGINKTYRLDRIIDFRRA